MKINIKTLINDVKFVELQNELEKISLDIFTKDSITDLVSFDYEKISYSKLKILYDSNFNHYISALQKIDELYSQFSADYPTKIEFVIDMFTCLKNELSKYIQKSDNSLPKPQNSSTQYYEDKRKEYLDIIQHRTSIDLSLVIIENELRTQPISQLIIFIDSIESKANEIINKNILNSNDRRNVLEYLLLSNLRNSTTTSGNLLISQKISIKKNIFNPSNPQSKVLLPLLNTSSFLLNYINLHDSGLLANGIGFDGFSFFNINNGHRIKETSNLLNQTKMASAERTLQSNFVIDESLALALLNVKKKHMKTHGKDSLIYHDIENGDKIKVVKTLFRPQFSGNEFENADIVDDLKTGYFVKVKRINLNNGNYEIILYYFCDDQLKHGIQLFRTDKVEDLYRGMPASHILRGGEKIETTLHMHVYNLIDATIKNPEKESSLGAMDIAYKFLNPTNITLEAAEEFFNKFCGITSITLENKNISHYSYEDTTSLISQP